MVILKGSTMVNFYRNSGKFFSRRRTKTRVSSFERKMFAVSEKIKFIIFLIFLTSIMQLEVDNFIFLKFWGKYFKEYTIEDFLQKSWKLFCLKNYEVPSKCD